MGEVWTAKHGLLERPAAIKFIRPEAMGIVGVAAREIQEQFEREAQATATLESPHTIELYDFGVTEGGRFYYVMELLDGFDLQRLVVQYGPVPTSRAIYLLRQVCHSLTEAHAGGLIHRDVKPSNIFTCRRGLDYDFVKVLDFGLVRRFDQHLEGKTVDCVGTPGYMAPEIVLGHGSVDGRADLYALGCVAFWLVTGRSVFEGGSIRDIIMKHVSEAPPPLQSLSEMRIPKEFERVVLDCLEKDPADRPASAPELSAKLAECEKVTGIWTQQDAEQWWILHRPRTARRHE